MIHPSSLIRLAVWGGVALFVRAIVREAKAADSGAPLLLPSGRAPKTRAGGRRKVASKARQ
jgi:hypothetical protein